MQNSDAASARLLGLLGLFLALLNFELVNELVHLEEAIVLLVHDHVVLKHVLITRDPAEGHGQLLRAHRRELARVQLPFRLTSKRYSALLVRCFLEQVGVSLAKLSGVIIALRYVCEDAAAFVFLSAVNLARSQVVNAVQGNKRWNQACWLELLRLPRNQTVASMQ